VRYVGTIEDHLTARRLDKPVDTAKQRRLSRTRKTNEDHELATPDVEGNAVEGSRAARLDLHEVTDLEERRHAAQDREKKTAGCPAVFSVRRERKDQGDLLGVALAGAAVAGGRGVFAASPATSMPASFAASRTGSKNVAVTSCMPSHPKRSL